MGFMGSGKSTIGKKLANKLNCTHIDLDTLIERNYNTSIYNIFIKSGENQFRKLESITLKSISTSNIVISTGGGTPCFLDNIKWIKENGISIYLTLDEKSIYNRLKKSKKDRPLINSLNDNELKKFIKRSLTEREKFYNEANIRTKSLNLKIKDLIKLINDYSK